MQISQNGTCPVSLTWKAVRTFFYFCCLLPLNVRSCMYVELILFLSTYISFHLLLFEFLRFHFCQTLYMYLSFNSQNLLFLLCPNLFSILKICFAGINFFFPRFWLLTNFFLLNLLSGTCTCTRTSVSSSK